MPKTSSVSDEELVQIVRNEDQEQYRELVARYQAKLLRYADKLVKDQPAAADIVQQSFIKAYINLQGFNVKQKFSSWIYRIVHNEAINYLKKHQKKVLISDHSMFDAFYMFSHENKIETHFEENEFKNMMQDKLDRLPLIYRDPLILYYYEEKSYEEISDILKLPVGTVGTRMNRAKQKMLELFNK